jgi:hypothetical protein
VPGHLAGPGPRTTFHFEPLDGLGELAQLSLFVQECLVRGVFHNGNLLPSFAHGEQDVEQTLAVFHEALTVVARAREQRSTEGLLHLAPLQRFQDVWSDSMRRRDAHG